MKTMIGFHKKGRAEGYSIKAVSTSVEMELFGALAIAEPSSSLHLKPSMEHENRRLREMYKISIKIQNWKHDETKNEKYLKGSPNSGAFLNPKLANLQLFQSSFG